MRVLDSNALTSRELVVIADPQIPFRQDEGLMASKHSIVLSKNVPVLLLEEDLPKKPIGMSESVPIELMCLVMAVVVGVVDLLAVLTAIDSDDKRVPGPKDFRKLPQECHCILAAKVAYGGAHRHNAFRFFLIFRSLKPFETVIVRAMQAIAADVLESSRRYSCKRSTKLAQREVQCKVLHEFFGLLECRQQDLDLAEITVP